MNVRASVKLSSQIIIKKCIIFSHPTHSKHRKYIYISLLDTANTPLYLIFVSTDARVLNEKSTMKNLIFDTYVPFAWQGIGLTIPSEWNPGKISGEPNSGEARLDDSQIARLELEWRDARGDDRVAQIADRYIEGLAKNAKKQKSRLRVERNPKDIGLDLPAMKNTQYFVWESRYTVHTLATYSPTSDRLIFIRIMGRTDENLDSVLPLVLNTLTDTPSGSPLTWALYDLVCQSPPEYELENFELKSGHIGLRFQKDSTRLNIDRFSLARTILNGKDLDEWYVDFFTKDLRHIHVETDIQTRGPNIVLSINGYPKSRWQGLLQPLPFWNMRPRQNLSGRVWTDMDTNKIFSVQTFWKKSEGAPDLDAYCKDVTAIT